MSYRMCCIFLLIVLTAGCSSRREHTVFDRLWWEGYGFNNPNPDRIRRGLPPLDFDESVDRE